ncbi:leucyl aminopeptidase [Marinimicrobium alkaliphilum]|uniref:leucyl aminopeptidase n=1 Tax=Marinimicrobium alkaliphilum TaxID=2202654 RepID=UPI000DBA6EB9|nr:leucyl aminopeptidase [Marinimicrobium alkaliphilum]
MQLHAKVIDPVKHRTDCLLVGCYQDGTLLQDADTVDRAGDGKVRALIKREKFQGKAGQTLLIHDPAGLKAERLLLVGLGKPESDGQVGPDNYRTALTKALAQLGSSACRDVTVAMSEIAVNGRDIEWCARQAAELLGAQLYCYSHTKSQKPETHFTPKSLTFTCLDKRQCASAQRGLEVGSAIAEGQNYARELGNLPGNICTPTYLANEAKRLARNQPKLSVKVLDEKQMKELGMGALLSVSAGSEQPAKLIVMEYKGAAKSQAPIALIGKGITFDTGGISLKPGAGMDEMKFDMCGAASVLGTAKTLLALQPALNVVMVVAASENMPNGRATKPGDVVTSMSGQTIEVLNTDAEGRLVLCDAITYTQQFKPKAMVDIATLTGACVIALGNHATGLYSNRQELADTLLKAGIDANDKAWQMPLWDEYQKQLDSNFADMANIGGREAGSVTAACFLSRYAKDTPWAHLDVAGTAWKSGGAKGATGRPVPLLVQYLLSQS